MAYLSLLNQNTLKYIVYAILNGTGAPELMEGVWGLCMLLDWGPEFESHTQHFCQIFFSNFSFTQLLNNY